MAGMAVAMAVMVTVAMAVAEVAVAEVVVAVAAWPSVETVDVHHLKVALPVRKTADSVRTLLEEMSLLALFLRI